jgi:tubulin polyglutamylase TTLL6/13
MATATFSELTVALLMAEPPKKRKRRAPAVVSVNVTNTRYTIVGICCTELGYKLTESETKALLFWCDAGGNFEFTSTLNPWQFYNHFPGTWAIARKVDLARNIERMSRILPDIYNFHPKSFVVPCQTADLQTYLTSQPGKSRRTFIVKPDRGSLGKGIILIRDPDAIDDWTDLAIAQQYIAPWLIEGLKFDLRIYALVTSVEPLRIYLHEEGMARFCTQPYVKPVGNNLQLSYSHLTNYSLNNHNPNFEEPMEAEHADHGHKRSMSSVFKVMADQGLDIEKLKGEIEDIIRLTVISIQPLLATNYRTAIPWHDGKSRCFEVLGFDVLIDKRGSPWVLEVNWAPALANGSPFDVSIKTSVVKGALKIVNINPDFKRVVKNRRKNMSQCREPVPPFDPGDEIENAKDTQYHLIYPLDKAHPKYEMTERAFAESKTATVGASVRGSKARQIKDIPPPTPAPTLSPPVKRMLSVPRALQPSASMVTVPKAIQPSSAVVPVPKALQSSSSVVATNPPRPTATIEPRLVAPVARSQRVHPLALPQVLPRRVVPDDSLPLFVHFADLPAVTIDQEQEFERFRAMRRQVANAENLQVPEFIGKLVGAANVPAGKISILKGMRPGPKSVVPVVKSTLVALRWPGM